MSGCWLWTGGNSNRDRRGGGGGLYYVVVHGQNVSPRRYAYAGLVRQPASKVLQTCATDNCVNPAHAREAMGADEARDHRKAYMIRYHYGLSRRERDRMMASQRGRCPICTHELEPDGKGKRSAATDHNHATLAIREILCRSCNTGLGMFNEDPAALRAAANYIERHAAKSEK